MKTTKLTTNDLQHIAAFHKVIKNYIKMINLLKQTK